MTNKRQKASSFSQVQTIEVVEIESFFIQPGTNNRGNGNAIPIILMIKLFIPIKMKEFSCEEMEEYPLSLKWRIFLMQKYPFF